MECKKYSITPSIPLVMPLDISKSHTKTEINLSKPYHKGPLLIDIKPRSGKSLIDIKPIRKAAIGEDFKTQSKPFANIQENQDFNTPEDKFFAVKPKASTLDFDKLEEFNDLLNPFAQYDNENFNRSASEIQIHTQVNENYKIENNNKKSKTKLVGDIKKPNDKVSGASFSSLKPKINVAPLHSKSRILAESEKNKSLTKNLKQNKDQPEESSLVDGYIVGLENFKTISSDINFESLGNKDLFEFKAPPKFDSRDIPQFAEQRNFTVADNNPKRLNLSQLDKELHNSSLRKKIRNNNRLKRYSVSTLFTTVIVIFCTLFLTGNAQWMGKFGEKNVQADKNRNFKSISYDKWVANNNFGKYSPPGDDLDKDGLNNYEEFLINSMPSNKHSCNPNITDNDNLLNLIDPTTCLAIDFTSPGQLNRFKDVLNLTAEFIQKHESQKIQNQSYQTPSIDIKLSQSSSKAMTDMLPIPTSEIKVNTTQSFTEMATQIQAPKVIIENATIKKPLETKTLAEPQAQVLNTNKVIETTNSEALKLDDSLVLTVQRYIDQFRSYDKFDDQAANPVNAEYFVEMSKKYNVPLKYVLAVARSESRFGTDQFNQDGNKNRIGRHLNIYSIGLDDNGGSITYPSWEAGVDAFGRWYTKFENQGYSDCSKWRIYNPNGDYCQKIENLASQIENYIAG